MSVHIMGECDCDKDVSHVVQQLEEMHKVCPPASVQLLLWNSSQTCLGNKFDLCRCFWKDLHVKSKNWWQI